MSDTRSTDVHSETTTDTTGDPRLDEAGAQLSTAPAETAMPGSFGGPRAPGAKGGLIWTAREIIGWSRWFWRQLTSMRVALLLLFLLSLGAIPGSLIPQTGTDVLKVEDFKRAHSVLGPLYDRLGLFHVYSSVWFSAIYILLFVSLIGCIVPRTWQFVGQLRGRPPAAPKRLTRLPAYATWRTDAEPEQVRETALEVLGRRRFRARLSGDAVAAEKGYLREFGNLVFHVALIVMLVAFAWGQLFKSEGNKLIVEGDGFSNTLTQYDDIKYGSLFTDDDLVPFSFDLKNFTGTYERTGPNKGTPRTYQADVTYSVGAYGKEKKATVKVNRPLEIGDAKVYLVSHGYAPVVTVRDGKGAVVFHAAVPLLPLDSNVTSQGAIKVMDGYRNAQGQRDQLGFLALFVPTFAGAGKGDMFSQFPALDFPVLALNAYHGDLGVDAGLPQNVYQLDTKNLKQFKDAKGNILKDRLLPGETMKLPGGNGSITFEKDIKEWAGFQVVQQPGSGWALGGALAAIFGLAASLFIQRRRVWVRATTGADGVTVVEMAGLGRSESAKLPEELGDLAALVHDRAPTKTDDPDDPDDPDADPDQEPGAPSPEPAAEGAEQK
ncbi:cytochrome c biogenesis protein ResB [Streptomyces nodosus]|uniref:Cytochrome C biogenesis protein n=1 Tax=Streptomyces nodosus TaxID=40318 RepID=A0A0B5DPE6_9ACTN|nr:cytochrome c biogenesis protein ResB [Streptomyces nodosus]AJE41897.1 cytochrome C biogenesis protein [Streptomyces nodosus]MBB4793137.1 cytochrome c biogenesis protein [Streptomyces nodosus]QEV40430.1 cytochrome c biogenesis protein ResB [Streptomyces nodosus]